MQICFNANRKVPLTLVQTRHKPEKTVAAPKAARRKICVRSDIGRRNASPNNPPNNTPKALRNAPVTP